MGFPDRIERTVELAARPERVWAALTTAEGLGGPEPEGGHHNDRSQDRNT